VFKRVNRALDHLEERLIATLIAAATALIFVSVLHRYGTGVSINLSKWAAAHGVPFVPEILTAVFCAKSNKRPGVNALPAVSV